jgi:hypothetical protein
VNIGRRKQKRESPGEKNPKRQNQNCVLYIQEKEADSR